MTARKPVTQIRHIDAAKPEAKPEAKPYKLNVDKGYFLSFGCWKPNLPVLPPMQLHPWVHCRTYFFFYSH